MIKLKSLHKIHNSEEYVHVFTEKDLQEIELNSIKNNITIQKAVKEFAKTCSWKKVD